MDIKKDSILKEAKLQNEKSTSKNDSVQRATEIGGFKGQDPTKYGDWQHKGRVTDF